MPLSIETPLFNANGNFGTNFSGTSEYPRLSDLLSHLDRLGIGRSLVWHSVARDQYPPIGNRLLLEEIQKIPQGRDRLIPVFGISPSMLYARNEIKDFESAVEKNQVQAVQLFPSSQRHSLRALDPLFKQFEDRFKLALCSVKEGGDLSELADRYPSTRFVVQHVMWGGMGALLDLMRRCKNVWCDISWMHSASAIKMICSQFGAERVVFGLGYKTQQGAAIADLACAEITKEQRSAIAHGNLDSLLGLSPSPIVKAGIISDPNKKMWNRILNGKVVSPEILDAHGHLGAIGTWMLERQKISDQVSQAIIDMDRLGIKTAYVSGMDALHAHPVEGNRLLATALRSHTDRFRGWIVYNPHFGNELEENIAEFLNDPFFVGFKLLNDYWQTPVTDKRLIPMWKHANRLHLPILLHTWDTNYDSPAMLTEITAEYPDASFLLGHSGGGNRGRLEAIELARKRPNVYLEWCGSFTSDISWEKTLAEVNHKQVIFGTDAVVHSYFWELGRLLSLDVSDETLKPILGDNFRAVLARRKGISA